MHPQLRKKLRAFSSAGSEHLPYKQRVGGSNPSTPTEGSYFSCRMLFGRLAQLVQSICLTSRGSAVRIRQRPQPKSIDQISLFGRLAQLVQSICLTSRGSAVRIRQRPQLEKELIRIDQIFPFGRLAQLVQSICLTSRGSAVRIRQRPRRIPPRCGIFCFYTLLFLYAGVLPKVYLRSFRKLQENFGFFSFVHRILWLGVLRCFLYTFELC